MRARGRGTGTIRRRNIEARTPDWVECEHICSNHTDSHRFKHRTPNGVCWFGGTVRVDACEDCLTWPLDHSLNRVHVDV